jgi:hypothetical protein
MASICVRTFLWQKLTRKRTWNCETFTSHFHIIITAVGMLGKRLSPINDAISNSDYIALDDWMIVNNELERIWKEAVVT